MKNLIFQFCRLFTWFIIFNFFHGCLNPASPPIEKVEEIYIGCVLRTGTGVQKVYVTNSTTDPENITPGDSSLFIKDAIVTISCPEFSVQLTPDSAGLDNGMAGPYFSTQNQKTQIKPETTFQLSVVWQGKEFTAQTQTPVAPIFLSIDSSEIVIQTNEFGESDLELAWTSPDSISYISVDYPRHLNFNWGGNGREKSDYWVPANSMHLFTYWWDSVGVTSAVVYSTNADYKQCQQSADELADVDIPQKYFSNINGAHGVFAAMASDTLTFKYRKE